MDESQHRTPKTQGLAPHTFWFLIAFYALAVVGGIRGAYVSRPSALDILLPLSDALCLSLWALADARRCGYCIPLTSQWLFLVFATVVVPAYVIWSRGWRGLGWIAINVVGWFIFATVTTVISMTVLGLR